MTTGSSFVHVVLLRFSADASDRQRERFIRGLRELFACIADAEQVAYGLDAAVNADDDHFDLALTARFPDPERYLAYEESDAHTRFVRECAASIVVGRATAQFWWPAVPAGAVR
jgi:hypothetical protein